PGYTAAWKAVRTYFQQAYPALANQIDKGGHDVARLCFVSHDPELYENPEATPFIVPYEQPQARKAPRPRLQSPPAAASDQARVEEALWFIPSNDYDVWLKVGMALQSTGAPWAQEVWERWSAPSPKFDENVQGYKWGSFHADGGITIATLFALAKE